MNPLSFLEGRIESVRYRERGAQELSWFAANNKAIPESPMTKHSSADRSYGNMSLCIWFVSAASPAIAAFAVIGVRAAVVGSGKTIPHTAAAMVE